MTNENNNEDQSIEFVPNIKKYELSIVLLGQQSQLFWFSYGAFLIVETGILSIMLSFNDNSKIFVVSVVGFLLSILWGFSYNYNNTFWKLRIKQLKDIEIKTDCSFFKEGRELSDQKNPEKVRDIKMPKLSLIFSPYVTYSLIIIFFGVIFIWSALCQIGSFSCSFPCFN